MTIFSVLGYCSTRMNGSSNNLTFKSPWMDCIDNGYVGPVICQCTEVLCFLLGTPALVWCLWISLSGGISGGLKPTQIFPINLFVVELLFCFQALGEVIYSLFPSTNTMLLQFANALYYIAWTCRPLFQSCICVERYMAVVQPVAFIKYRLRGGGTPGIYVHTHQGRNDLKQDLIGSRVRGFYQRKQFTWRKTGGVMAPLFQTCICVERYMAVVQPVAFINVYCLGVVVISVCCFFILRVLKQPGPGEVEGGRGGEKKQGTTDPQKMRAFRVVLTNLVIILMSSISVVVSYVILPNSGIDFSCNIFPMLLACNMLSVMVSPLLHLHREGRLHCRKGPETN
ncbi:hypothetical protein DPEC_G00184590 [Dallia pectoralis]|uniref:Uncharacterized protein n=1 Tax=Dallia pectoralis TaxID=75939 RepID=A0ACC2GB23_DALPE|nr:hypothetical protein DPEC_G00184590 [Dallia pectoralis]